MSERHVKGWSALSPLRLIRWAVQNKFFEGLILIVSVGSVGLGTTFIFAASSFANSPSFREVFHLVNPAVLGTAMVLSSAGLAATALRDETRAWGVWPGAGMVFLYLLMSWGFLRSVPLGGVPSGVWTYCVFAFVYVWIVAGCAFIQKEEEDNDSPSEAGLAHNA